MSSSTTVTDPQAGGSGLLPTKSSDDVRLVCSGLVISGWETVAITRGIEIMPSTFDISLTERYPGNPSTTDIKPGAVCRVYIGSTLVLTGYVDRRMPAIGPDGNVVRIVGRSSCEDLVDCDVDPDKLPNMQIASSDVLTISQGLAAQYGIGVTMTGTGNGAVIPQFNVNLGEKPYQTIERIARYSALLVYDDVDGNLVLADVGAGAMASGFAEGQNIERAASLEGMDQRFSDVSVYLTSTAGLQEGYSITPLYTAKDTFDPVPRFRKIIIVAEQAMQAADFAITRGKWEVARRWGRSQACSLTVDSWRDGAGTLWRVNCFANLDVPHLKLVKKKWIISQVTFRRDKSGTHADVVMMPKEAFTVEPTILQPLDPELAQAIQPGGGAAAANPDQNTLPGPAVPATP